LVRRKHAMAPLWGLPKTTGLAGQKMTFLAQGMVDGTAKNMTGQTVLKQNFENYF